MNQKIKSYVGFAIKSGHSKIGTDNILKSKNIKVIVICSNLSDNAKRKIANFSAAPILVKDGVLPDGVLALGVTDSSLASAIISANNGECE